MKSLYERLRETEHTASDRRKMAAACSDPRTRHEIEVSALAAEKEAATISEIIAGVESLVMTARTFISALRGTFPSANITLALRHAEDAESRLIRELGQP